MKLAIRISDFAFTLRAQMWHFTSYEYPFWISNEMPIAKYKMTMPNPKCEILNHFVCFLPAFYPPPILRSLGEEGGRGKKPVSVPSSDAS